MAAAAQARGGRSQFRKSRLFGANARAHGRKLFAVIVILIALASAVPIITHTFVGASVTPPEDISTHGSEIDKQMDETMIEAGLSFLAAQIVLATVRLAVWRPRERIG